MFASDTAGKARQEISFIDYVVRPLYVALGGFSAELSRRCLALIDANRATWAAEANGRGGSLDLGSRRD